MSLYAVLDEIELEVITWMGGLEARFGAQYAEQGLIGRKALLQHTGFAPDEIEITASLHAAWCNPAQEIARLKEAMDAARPMAFVLGTGEYRGVFVIESMDLSTRQTDGVGALLALELRIKLREYIGDPAEPLPPGVIQAGLRIPIAAVGDTEVPLSSFGGPVAAVGAAVSGALAAVGQIGRAASQVQSLVSLARQSGPAALLLLPGAAASLAAAAQALPVEGLTALRSIQHVASSATAAAAALGGARTHLERSANALGAGLDGLSGAMLHAQMAVRAGDQSRDALARLAHTAILKEPRLWPT